jgi:UDP-N-acetyl-D-mannosaminuronic acid dehydrogenase
MAGFEQGIMSSIPQHYMDGSVCVLGMGYVGLTLGAALADVGFRVFGVEIRDDVVSRLEAGEPHFYEPGLADQLGRLVRRGDVTFTRHIPDGCNARVYIITVGTPLGPDGRSRLDMVDSVSREVAVHLRDGDMVILRSTVKLGTTRDVVQPILDATGVDYDLAFCPERTLEGRALVELRQLPQIIGGVSLRSSVRAAQFFQFLTPTVLRVADAETAEMIKLVDNTQRDVNFAFANEVARMCDAAGVQAIEVINAGKLGYPRTDVALPGPVGGPCLEKDPHILAESMIERGITPDITLAARRTNERQPAEVADYLVALAAELDGFPERPVITVLGIAFKGRPATDDLRGTMARPVLAELRSRFPDARFRGFDPIVQLAMVREFGLEPCDSLEQAFAGSNICVIMNNHPAFAAMPVETLADSLARPGVVYDFWNCYAGKTLRLPPGTSYVALGGHGRVVSGEESDPRTCGSHAPGLTPAPASRAGSSR